MVDNVACLSTKAKLQYKHVLVCGLNVLKVVQDRRSDAFVLTFRVSFGGSYKRGDLHSVFVL